MRTEPPRSSPAAVAVSGALATVPLPADAARWRELLETVDVPSVAERFVERVREIDGYRQPRVPLSRIHEDAVESFTRLLESLATGDPELTRAIAIHVGVTRARAEVPLISLMSAIQLDFSMIWDELCALGGPGDAELLLRHTNSVWHVVDNYVRQTEQAYLEETHRMEDEAASVRRALITELLGEPSPPPSRLEQLSELLGLDPDADFLAVLARGDAIAPARVEIARLERSGHRVLPLYHHGGLAIVLPLEQDGVQESAGRLRELPVGVVEPVAGLARVSAAARFAGELATLAEEQGRAVTPESGWRQLLRRRVAGQPLAGVFDFDDALAACGRAERTHLLAAVSSYLRTGSASMSAAELYCHRNTVTNRLRRFAELTGIDVTVPVEAARAVIAFA